MIFTPPERTRWLLVFTYAAAMAWVEAAVVFYLRLLNGGLMDPYQPGAFPPQAGISFAEIIREAATLVMLLAVGGLAGRTWRTRMAYTLMAFGTWDIFYYVFLKVITGWPNSLLDWDILFLIPLPWWGPVIAPMSIAVLMVFWGTLVSQWDDPQQPVASGTVAWSLCWLGVGLALFVFMADALAAVRAGKGIEELRHILPAKFNWPLFLLAWLLMAAPVVAVARQILARRNSENSTVQQ